MGRWCWTHLRGNDERTVRITTAYRAARYTNNPSSTMAVYAQKRCILNSLDDDRSPRDAMIEDLCSDIKEYKAQGDIIIVIADWNSPVDDDEKWTRKLRDLGMKEASQSRNMGKLPPTYNIGKKPIDGVFICSQIKDFTMGYLEFGNGPVTADHRRI